MKEQKKQDILLTSIRLFAKNGFHQTSVQDIVKACNMSKGAFYNYFSSKEELHIAIFKHYFEEVQKWMDDVEREQLSPREKMKKQLYAPFILVEKQKSFIVMYLREQSFSINKDLREFMTSLQQETISWYEKSLESVYGPDIKEYFGDLILTVEGIRKSYLSAILFLDSKVDAKRIPDYLMNRLDELVGALRQGELPVAHSDIFQNVCPGDWIPISTKEKVLNILSNMEKQLNSISIDNKEKEGLRGVLQFLIKEFHKDDYDRYVFQGMLANLKCIKSFDEKRKEIAILLNIQML